MKTVDRHVTENLTIEPLGTILELRVTGREQPSSAMHPSGPWTKPVPDRTVSCTLSVDDAMELREGITEWLKSIGAEL